MVEVRASADGGCTWDAWQQYTIVRTTSPAEYVLPVYRSGIIVETRVYTVGDGSKAMSVASNTVTAVAMAEPVKTINIFRALPMYIDGTYKAQVIGIIQSTSISMPQWYQVTWRKEDDEWEYGWVVGRTVDDKSYPGNTYTYKAAALTNNGLISEFTNPATVTLPAVVTNKLLPPTPLFTQRGDVIFTSDPSDPYYGQRLHGVGIYLSVGDYRATVMHMRYKYNNGSWQVYNNTGYRIRYENPGTGASYVSDLGCFTLGFGIEHIMSDNPQPGDIITMQLKNSAWNSVTQEGDLSLIDSDWSESITYTYPDYSIGYLPPPVLSAYQQWQTTYVTCTWNAIDHAIGYKVEKAIAGETDWRVSAECVTSTEYHDYDVDEAIRYKYRVTALGDNVNYYDSVASNEVIAYIEENPDLDPPTIVSATEVNPNYEAEITLEVTDIDPNALWIMLEYQKDGGAWTEYGMLGISNTYTLAGPKIKFGGDFIFRCYAIAGATGQSDYSNSVQCTLKERVYFWDSTTGDDPSGLTGGWYSPNITDSEGTQYGGVSISRQSDGSMKTSGQGYWMTRNELTTQNAGLSSIYSKICMVGSLVKTTEGQNNFARFGNGWTYYFSGGVALQQMSYIIAGSESGRGAIGTKTDTQLTHSACGVSSYANRIGTHIYFMLYGGSYTQYTAIFAIKK